MNKNKQHKNKSSKKCSTTNNTDKYNKIHKNCVCEQHFYMPLPALNYQPCKEQLTPSSWFRPGLVEGCCVQCSSVKPIYSF